MGVQHIDFESPEAWKSLMAINDVAEYMSLEITVLDGLGYLVRDDVDLKNLDGYEHLQWYNNALLISGLVEMVDDQEHLHVWEAYEKLIGYVTKSLQLRLDGAGLSETHQVIRSVDELDTTLSVVRNEDASKYAYF